MRELNLQIARKEKELEAAIVTYKNALYAEPKGQITSSICNMGSNIYYIADQLNYLREEALKKRLADIDRKHFETE